MSNVALLGVGIMGLGMAENLLKAGFSLTVYNRTQAKATPLAEKGAKIAVTPREAAQDADAVIAMVGDDAASKAVWLGDTGALAGARTSAILIECSTLTPEWVRELGRLAAQRGCKFVDSPVTGSKQAAASATLRLFVGGEPDAVERAMPYLQAISVGITHLGSVGAGATWKLINNLMTGIQLAALAEGIGLAERAGIDLEKATPLITDSGFASPVVKGKFSRILERSYDNADFYLQWMHKDISYATELGKQMGVPLKVAEAALQIYQQARDKGLDHSDWSAVVESLRS